MLNWFLENEQTEAALHGSLVEEEMVEVQPELVPMKVLDPSKYFTIDAWKQVQGVIATLEKKGEWSCSNCSEPLETKESISCDSCLEWMHMNCVGLKSQPKCKFWICRSCHSQDN